MSWYPAVIVMGAVEEEGTFWIQLLMMVMLAAGAGIYILFKSRVKRAGRETHDEVIETIIETPVVSLVEPPKYLVESAPLPPLAPPEHRRIEWPAASEIKPPVVSEVEPPVVSEVEPRQKNLTSGMELLARNFLVSVVERTDSPDQRDVAMRRLCFVELTRRGELWSLASTALKIYTLDEDGFYGKVIRFEAMAELAGRTRPDKGAVEDSETVNEPGRSRTAKESHNIAEIPPASPTEKEPAAHHAG